MGSLRAVIGECAVATIGVCVTFGAFLAGRAAPLHQYLPLWTEEQSVASLGIGLLLGGIVLSTLQERRTGGVPFVGMALFLLTASPLLWALYAEGIRYWQVYVPACMFCFFAGAALGRAAKLHLIPQSLDRRTIVLLAWVCTLGVTGLFVKDALRREIRSLPIATFLIALIPIALGILGFLGAANAYGVLFHLGEHLTVGGWPLLLGLAAYLASIVVIRRCWCDEVQKRLR